MVLSKSPAWLVLLPGLLVLGCPGATEPDPYADCPRIEADIYAETCVTTAPWGPGETAFVEATAEWGLEDIAVRGFRLSAVDWDGDGWADLVVRRGADAADDFGPEGTRQTWLLRNTGSGHFEDRTEASGIRAQRTPDGTGLGRPGNVFAFADVDNDGDLDVFTGLANADTSAPVAAASELMLNNGDGTFSFGPEGSAARMDGAWRHPSGAAFVDYDLDGSIDLWMTQSAVNGGPQQDRLFRGDGSGDLAEVWHSVGLTTEPWGSGATALNEGRAHSYGWGALACDLNNDGAAELLASSYGRAPNHLWQASGSPSERTYVNRSVASGYAFDHRVDWSDNESARCHCQLHPSDPDCAGVEAPQYISCGSDADAFRWTHSSDRNAYRLGGNSGATVCGDVDNDGFMDLLTTEIVHWDVGSSSDPSELLYNSGEADIRFERPGNEATGLTRTHDMVSWNDGDITGALFDFDDDGRLDVYVGSTDYEGARGLLYHQRGDGTFEAVPLADGIDHTRSHGIAVADFDRDGDLDVVVGHSRSRCGGAPDCYETTQVRLFENQGGDNRHWLQLDLEGGAGSNRAAIGAAVIAQADGLLQRRVVDGGHGHYGAQHDLVQHLGLGGACEARVEVVWPDRDQTSQCFHLASGQRYTWAQGEAPVPVSP